MNDVIIRSAEKNDFSGIIKLCEELKDTVKDKKGIDATFSVERLNDIKKKGHYLIVAKIENDIVGFINFTIRHSLLHSGPSAIIDELIVRKDYRNKGIGKLLVDTVSDKCKALGCCEIEVSTEKTNKRAKKFYKKCGFQDKGIIFEIDFE